MWRPSLRSTVHSGTVRPVLVCPHRCVSAGIWGYLQGGLERHVSGTTAVIVTALVFALLPHPPAGMESVPRVLFFFLVIFSTMAHLKNSILPGLPSEEMIPKNSRS
jgi:hypothetical protein